MAKPTMKSTKEELYNAFKEAERQLKLAQSVKSDPAAEAEKAQEAAAVESATQDVQSNVFSPELTAKFENLQAAIKAQEAYLETCFGVKDALIDMTVAANARKQALLDLDAELDQARAAAKSEQDAMRQESKRLSEELRQARERENEEYEYARKRERQTAEDAAADALALLDKQKAESRAALDKLVQETADLEAMRERIDHIQDELDARYAEGQEAGRKEAEREAGFKAAMAKKDHEYEIRDRDNQIARLEADLTSKAAKIDSLEAKVDAAYMQIRELAAKTVESSGGLKILSTSSDSGANRK